MKTVCVLSSGGSKGSFEAGVLKQLAEKNYKFDTFYGTSAGAINASYLVYYPMDELVNMWKNIKKNSDVFSINYTSLLWSSGLANLNPTRKLMNKLYSGKEKIARGVFCRTNLITGSTEYADSSQLTTEEIIDATLGSGSIPIALEDVKGYVDGGTREMTPLKIAIDEGADKIVVILCSPWAYDPMSKFTMPTGLFKSIKIGIRALELLEQQIFVDDIQTCIDMNNTKDKKKIEIELYAPQTNLQNTLDFSSASISKAIDLGYSSKAIQLG